MQALGGLSVSGHLRTLGSGAWGAFPRRRHYFMTLAESGGIVLPTRHDAPWEPGWGPIPSAVRPVHMLRVFLLRILESDFPGDSLYI